MLALSLFRSGNIVRRGYASYFGTISHLDNYLEPQPPNRWECCCNHNRCNKCIWTVYYEKKAKWELLRGWKESDRPESRGNASDSE